MSATQYENAGIIRDGEVIFTHENNKEIPDLYRIENGFSVSAYFSPSLKNPKSARVIVSNENGDIDCIEIAPGDDMGKTAIDVFRHTSLYSDPLSEYLNPKRRLDDENV